MSVTNRKALLLGSLPFESEEAAMEQSLSILGQNLISVPDGEVGEINDEYPSGSRSCWVCLQANECAEDSENWEVLQEAVKNEDGFPAGYDKIYTLRTKYSPEELHKHLNLHYHEYFNKSYPIFKRLRKKYGHPKLKFQLGIPTGMTLAIFMLEPDKAISYYKSFNKRLAYEANEALAQAADDIIVQLELPIEVGMVYQNQTDLATEIVMDLVNQFQYSTQIGLHFCCGDLNNEAWTHPDSLLPLVGFANRLIDELPKKHELAYIHVPLAEGDIPPTLDKSYYQPLANIQLPANTELFAGLVHEKRHLEELQVIHAHLENIRNHPVGVACSCGMGRRDTETGLKLMSMMKQLVDSDLN